MFHLDTHIVVWLHTANTAALPQYVRSALDAGPLSVSPMVELELNLLHEIGRTAGPGGAVLANLARTIGLTVSQIPFARVVSEAAALSWTRDPFDRVICAQALAENALLLTRDRRIHANFEGARWDQ
ncbi:MAG: type II toxin-antitoxin system VapC family toxin [Sporichthyaceae bacterium]